LNDRVINAKTKFSLFESRFIFNVIDVVISAPIGLQKKEFEKETGPKSQKKGHQIFLDSPKT